MAKETVQAVREAELKAVQLEKDAAINRDTILLKANEEAKELIASKTKEARVKAEQELGKSQQEGEKLLVSAKQRAEKEILLLKEMVKSKEQVAIDLVLSEVI